MAALGASMRMAKMPCFILAALPAVNAVSCPIGTPVRAFYAGSVNLGNGDEPCTPGMEACMFVGAVASGPDADGHYMINWEDGDPNNRRVHASRVTQQSSGETCSLPAANAPMDEDEDEKWVPPEIPCTLLPRLHWEGSDPKWNKEAIDSLKAEFRPDEVIDGFDWHVIMRFHDVNRCEKAFNTINNVLAKCEDKEKCYNHPYVKAIEYVGDDPETRRKTGRPVFNPADHPEYKQEL